MKKVFTTNGNDKIASVGDLEWKEVKAILKAILEDNNMVIHKLEIREKSDRTWRVIVRASRESENIIKKTQTNHDKMLERAAKRTIK